jgi:glycosyltransferase involved in cell wall biosynthesis
LGIKLSKVEVTKNIKMKSISITTPRVYHNFEVANSIEKRGWLEKIYTLVGLSRAIKYKKKIPLRKIKFDWTRFLRRDESDQEKVKRLARWTADDKGGAIIGMANWSLEVFKSKSNQIKILDIDHFTWSESVKSYVSRKKDTNFDSSKKLDKEKYVLQNDRIKKEYRRRNREKKINVRQLRREIDELDHADLAIVPVSYVKKAIVSAGYPKQKVKVLPYGYDKSIFYPKYEGTSKKGLLKLIYAGSISIRKGWFYLKEIIKRMKIDTNIRIDIAGNVKKEVKDDFYRFVEEEDVVNYLGFLSKRRLAHRMRQSDVFVFPSVLEGFGRTILQSIACGTPVVTSNATCGVDLVSPDVNGYVIDDFQMYKWCSAIKKIHQKVESGCLGPDVVYQSVYNLDWNSYGNRLANMI